MYDFLLFLHSLLRWLVLLSLLYAIFRSLRGWVLRKAFTRHDNFIRHTTATIAHVQLIAGCLLYFTSPLVHYYFTDRALVASNPDASFFSIIHVSCMLAAIVVITIASAAAKRKKSDASKYKTMAIGFGVALLLILVAIPWPFSPLAARPYYHPY